tara:strand:+ start:589 stop:972 length:384 start_codon:yes stop_codon:yes gene_type:complete
MSESKFKAAMVVVLNEENKVLILKRMPGSHWMSEKWAFPGGHIEKNEIALEAAHREVKEETSLTLDNIHKLKELEEVMVYYSTSQSGRVKIDFEHTDWTWVSYSELDDYDTTPNLKQTVKQALDKIK